MTIEQQFCSYMYSHLYLFTKYVQQERSALLRRWGELMVENKEELAKLLTTEMVKSSYLLHNFTMSFHHVFCTRTLIV